MASDPKCGRRSTTRSPTTRPGNASPDLPANVPSANTRVSWSVPTPCSARANCIQTASLTCKKVSGHVRGTQKRYLAPNLGFGYIAPREGRAERSERTHAGTPADVDRPCRADDAGSRSVRGLRARHPGARRRRGTGRLGLPALLGRLLPLQPRPRPRPPSPGSAMPPGAPRAPEAARGGRSAGSRPRVEGRVARRPPSGIGRAYRFTGPAGHQHEIFWDVERAHAPPARRSTYPERPQRAPSRGAPRQLDHVTVAAQRRPRASRTGTRDMLGSGSWPRTTCDEAPIWSSA